jgi:hypothetical protein
MAITKTQRRNLRAILARLDTKDPDFRASPEVKAALEGPLDLYLRSWVLPMLREVADGKSVPHLLP